MGNKCSINGKLAKNCWHGTISHALWWPKWPNMLSYKKKKEKKDEQPPPPLLPAGTSDHVQTKPPSPLKMESDPVKIEEKNDSKPSPSPSPSPPPLQPIITTKEESKVAIKKEEKEPAPIPKPEPAVKTEPAKPVVEAAKPQVFNRKMSQGLKADSVLRTKTGKLSDDFSLGRELGHGQFGTTFLCIEKATDKRFACKTISKRKLLTQEDVDDVRREVEILHHLSGNPSFVSIKGAYEDHVAVHVVMELCAGGELFDRIVKRGYYSEKKAADLTRAIVGVIEVCHSLGVMHRDLKPENFLFVNEEEDSPLKTIDFGLSMFFKPGQIFTDVVGSPYYVAPEVLCKQYGQEVDVWSAGVILYILLSGVPPFWGGKLDYTINISFPEFDPHASIWSAEAEQEIFQEVLHGDLDFTSDPWPQISDSAKDLVKKMLVRDPKKRVTAHQVLCHPWVQVDGVAPDKPLDSAVVSRLTQFSAMDKLKKMALRVIAESLSEEEIAGLKEMFKMIDTDNSGHITFEELKAGLERYGAKLNESEIYKLMKAADVDNNGTIDYGEFVAATLHLNKIEKGDHLYKAFSYFDKDGSGFITHDELQKACEEFGIKDIQLEEVISQVDENNDGRIDYNEFVAMMQKGDADTGKKRNQTNLNIKFKEPVKIISQ